MSGRFLNGSKIFFSGSKSEGSLDLALSFSGGYVLLSASYGGTGKSTTNMKTKSTFTSAGWDFTGETANGSQDIWKINQGDYPILSWQQ